MARILPWRSKRGRGENGQAMVEFVIVFPLQLLFTLLTMQYALIMIARVGIDHAAYQAARSALVACQDTSKSKAQVEDDAHRAASIFLIPIAGRSGVVGLPIRFPGWGFMDRSAAAQAKTRVEIDESIDQMRSGSRGRITATVEHDLELAIPVANLIFAGKTITYGGVFRALDRDRSLAGTSPTYAGIPHLTLTATRFIPKTWADGATP